MVNNISPAPLFEHKRADLLEFGPLGALEHLVAVGDVEKIYPYSKWNRNSSESIECFCASFQLHSLSDLSGEGWSRTLVCLVFFQVAQGVLTNLIEAELTCSIFCCINLGIM